MAPFKKYITLDNNQGIIWQRLCEKYPNATIKKYEVDYVLKLINEYIRECLFNEQEVRLTGIGVLKTVKRKVKGENREQYYVKFSKSMNLQRRIRVAKGTASEAELRQHAEKETFIQNKWKGIKENILANEGPEELKRVLSKYLDTSLDIKPI